jgi:hypothetical protein
MTDDTFDSLFNNNDDETAGHLFESIEKLFKKLSSWDKAENIGYDKCHVYGIAREKMPDAMLEIMSKHEKVPKTIKIEEPYTADVVDCWIRQNFHQGGIVLLSAEKVSVTRSNYLGTLQDMIEQHTIQHTWNDDVQKRPMKAVEARTSFWAPCDCGFAKE